MIEVKMFNSFQVFKNNNIVDSFGSHKAEELFKFLVLNKDRKISIYEIYDLFWNGFLDQNAKQNLNSTLYYIRKNLDISKFELYIKHDLCVFNPKNFNSDTDKFLEILTEMNETISEDEDKTIKLFKDLENIYDGELLPENINDIWVEEKRFYFQNLYIDKLIEVVDILFKKLETEKAMRYLDISLAKNRKREDLWLKKIELLIKLENYSQAKSVQNEYKKIFGEQDIDFIDLTLDNFSKFQKKEHINNFSNVIDNLEGGTNLNKQEFDFALELERKKRKKDYLYMEIEIEDNSNIIDLFNILSKNIRREDLINKNKDKIYILFRGIEISGEKKDRVIEKLSEFSEKVTDKFKIVKYE